jgi:hypothetical protein
MAPEETTRLRHPDAGFGWCEHRPARERKAGAEQPTGRPGKGKREPSRSSQQPCRFCSKRPMLRGQAKKHSVRAPLRCLSADERQPEFGKARTTKFKAAASDSLKIPRKQKKIKRRETERYRTRIIPYHLNRSTVQTVEPPIT